MIGESSLVMLTEDRSTFYTNDAKGYTDYAAYSQPPTRPVSSQA
jgi:hypothetical protein